MRILILFNKYEYRGGEDTYVDNLIRLLKSKGHKVYLYTKDSRDIKSILDKVKIGIGLFWNPLVESELTKIIHTFKPEVAHFHNIYPIISPIAYRICAQYTIKIVQTIHNYKFMCPNNSLFRAGKICDLCPKKRTFIPSLFFKCYHNSFFATLFYILSIAFHRIIHTFDLIDHYIFPSQFTQLYYQKYNGVPRKKSNYLPYHSYSSPQMIRNGIIKGEPYLLYLGRMTKEKGVIELIAAIKNEPRIKTYFVGNGPISFQIQQMAKEYMHITYISHVKHHQIYRLIKNASAVVVPSLWFEVLPNVILEAIQVKKTVYVPSSNPNLRSLKDKSRYIITYDGMEDLVIKVLKQKNSGVIKHMSEKEQLLTQISPEYHYKKIMSIYARKK